MLFTPMMVEKILSDEKTQTRRMVKPDDCTPCPWKAAAGDWFPLAIGWNDGESVRAVISDGPRVRYEVGKVMAIQPGRGKHAIAYLLLEGIRYCERAGAISEDDAHAEGFDSAADFCAYYAKLNGAAALERPAWALDFSLVEDEDEGDAG